MLCAATRNLGREHRCVTLPNAGSNCDGVAGDPGRARLNSHHEFRVKRGGNGENTPIDDRFVVDDRNRGTRQVGLSRTIGAAHQSLSTPSANR